MSLHTARLVITIVFFILAFASAVSRYWLPALAWALLAFAVGHPFVRNGRVDLFYDDPPRYVVVENTVYATVLPRPYPPGTPAPAPEPTGAAPLPQPVQPGTPPVVQSLLEGRV